MHATALSVLALLVALAVASVADSYRGVQLAPEHRCAPYHRTAYRYSPSLEPRIVASLGEIYCPYTGTCFGNMAETDIEHIVALSEAHDSGLCAAAASVKAAFASDTLNLTLAEQKVNRHSKGTKDLAEWTPRLNLCWFVARTLAVRRKYGLTIDRTEAAAAEAVLSRCAHTVMEIPECVLARGAATPPSKLNAAPSKAADALAR